MAAREPDRYLPKLLSEIVSKVVLSDSNWREFLLTASFLYKYPPI